MQDDIRPSQGSVKPSSLKQTPLKTEIVEPDASFKTPEQVSQDAPAAFVVDTPENNDITPEKPRGSGHHWFNLPWPPTKHEIIAASVVLFIAGFALTGYTLLNKQKPVKTAAPVVAAKKEVAPPKPTTVAAALTGLQVAPEINQRPVVGVMIENSPSARPQAGLSEAGVIFEAIAEGGITRFLALFQDQQPGNVGPVRSARPYYVQWNEGFRAAYVHAGGSADALAAIPAWGVQDLNNFAGGPFRREPARRAPHNLYSNVIELANVATQRGYKSEYTGFARKAATPAKTPTATSIDFNISSAVYNSHFAYDAASNTYLRSEGGAPQVDANNNKQLAPSVVVGMIVPFSYGGKTSQGGAYSVYNVLGSGQAYVFQDGTVTIGSWSKASNTAQITFTDQAGKELKLNPGQTWLTALATSSKVSYR